MKKRSAKKTYVPVLYLLRTLLNCTILISLLPVLVARRGRGIPERNSGELPRPQCVVVPLLVCTPVHTYIYVYVYTPMYVYIYIYIRTYIYISLSLLCLSLSLSLSLSLTLSLSLSLFLLAVQAAASVGIIDVTECKFCSYEAQVRSLSTLC